VRDARQQFLAVLIEFFPRIPGGPQLEPHLFKGLAGIADFIAGQDGHRVVQITLADGIGHVPHPFDGFDDLAGHPARQGKADGNGQQHGQDGQDVEGQLQHVFRGQVDVFRLGVQGYGAGHGQVNVSMGRDVIKAQALPGPREVGVPLRFPVGHQLMQVVAVDAGRIVELLAVPPDGHIEALIL